MDLDSLIIRAQLRNPLGGWDQDRDAWEELSIFESRGIVARRYKERHDREPNDQKCREVASNFVQGRQYFLAAEGAGALVRPLLLYYGVLALTRGLLLFLDPRLRETSLPSGHGLSARDWSQQLHSGHGGPKAIPDLRVALTRGTFSELARVTLNAEQSQLLKLTSGSEPWEQQPPKEATLMWTAKGSTAYPSGSTVTLRDLLARVPDLVGPYWVALDDTPRCFRADMMVVCEWQTIRRLSRWRRMWI